MQKQLRGFVLLVTICAAFPMTSPGAETLVVAGVATDRIDGLVHLDAAQRLAIGALFEQEVNATKAMTPADRNRRGPDLHRATLTKIRGLLTPGQLQIYDRTSVIDGGGLELPNAEMRVRLLERTVTLAPPQREVALQVYQEEFDSMAALPPGDRALRGMYLRQVADEQIRALLNPGQLAKDDASKAKLAAARADESSAAEAYLRSMPAMHGQPRQGNATFQLNGTKGSDILVVRWEQPEGEAAPKMRIEDGRAQSIEL